MYKEKRIYLIQLSSRLTATGARMLFGSYLPKWKAVVELNGGQWQEFRKKKKTFLLILCDSFLKQKVTSNIYAIRITDVTDNLVNDKKYKLKPSVLSEFDYVSYELAYRKKYLKEASVEFAQNRINLMGKRSRYIDHQVIKNQGLDV